MNILRDFIDFLRMLIDWWFVVEPWERALRVRFGKHIRQFGPGVHVKIPFLDMLYIQNIRRRVMSIGAQTLTTQDGSIITVNGSFGYSVDDVFKLHMTLHDAEATVLQHVMGVLSRYVAAHDLGNCTPEKIMMAVSAELNGLNDFGLICTDFFLSSFCANVKTLRLVSESLGGYAGSYSPLSTSATGGYAVAPSRGYR